MCTDEILYEKLQNYFGYSSFRQQQEDIVKSVLSKKDTLVIMPTGGGKSICFQVPALIFEGVTIVISPLIALMKDQVDGLRANGIEASYFNSSQTAEEQQDIFDLVCDKKIKLLYVAPESLSYLDNVLNEKYVSCIAVDEAHCISSWGHDFRPSYKQLGFLKRKLPNCPIIALTATADKATRADILEQLSIPHATLFLSSFDRKNISIEVRTANKRVDQIIEFIGDRAGDAGIVYCLSRKATESLNEKLQSQGIKSTCYHAGLSFDERSEAQESFLFDKIQVVCATIAFGMGIDKSNVRWVIHYNMPKNIEGYYQEIGRGGRDGLKAEALLFHSYADVIQLRKFVEGTANEDVQLAKLDRMKQFAEAGSCRRKILLSYFGELLSQNCGNCDVCKNPPKVIDGTVIAQKALSTIVRLKEQEAAGTVIDVLRGARNANIVDKAYDKTIKSFGVGKDISWQDWQHYIIQLINLGLCEIAFHKNSSLRLTAFSKSVLFDGQKVQLTKPILVDKKVKVSKQTKKQNIKADSLFERLRALRLEIARKEDIPAYRVFNDASLRDMERVRPTNGVEFKSVSGVGQRKYEVYGDDFINEVVSFLNEKKTKKKSSNTQNVTYDLYQKGMSIEQIAAHRSLTPTTIFSHIASLYTSGKSIDMYQFISKEEVEKVRLAKMELNKPTGLRPYYEYFDENMDYFKIRIALTIIEKNGL